MTNQKRGFVFYFDSCPALLSLPPDQRGWLISALCLYAERVCREEGVGLEQVLESFPQLSNEARVALRFMGGAVLRDTQRWIAQREARCQRRQSRSGEPGAPQDPDARVREDMARMRRILQGDGG